MNSRKITEVRKKLGLSQGDLAQTLGVRTTTVSQWETGKAKPSKVNQAIIARLEDKADGETSVKEVLVGFAIAGGVTAFLAWLWSENNKK